MNKYLTNFSKKLDQLGRQIFILFLKHTGWIFWWDIFFTPLFFFLVLLYCWYNSNNTLHVFIRISFLFRIFNSSFIFVQLYKLNRCIMKGKGMYSTDVVSTNTNKLIWIIFRLYKTMNECNQITAVRVEFLNQTIKRKNILFLGYIFR